MISFDPKKIRIAAIMTNAVLMKVALILGGFYGGRALDVKYHSDPYFMTAGICLGLGIGLWWVLFTAKKYKL